MNYVLPLLALCVLLVGCKTSRPPAPAPTPMARAATAPAAKTVTVSWLHPETNVTFNIYSGSEPQPTSLRLRANTAAHSYTLPATNSAEFLGVKAVRNGVESDWATK